VSDRKRILLVEDDPLMAKVLTSLLESRGFRVVHRLDGMAGLKEARSEAFDLLVLDWLLPSLDGFKICKLLKMDARFNQLPILVVTGRTEPSEIERIRTTGVDDVICKSVPPADIVSCIETRIGTARNFPPT